jgi:hypothetical protein
MSWVVRRHSLAPKGALYYYAPGWAPKGGSMSHRGYHDWPCDIEFSKKYPNLQEAKEGALASIFTNAAIVPLDLIEIEDASKK